MASLTIRFFFQSKYTSSGDEAKRQPEHDSEESRYSIKHVAEPFNNWSVEGSFRLLNYMETNNEIAQWIAEVINSNNDEMRLNSKFAKQINQKWTN